MKTSRKDIHVVKLLRGKSVKKLKALEKDP